MTEAEKMRTKIEQHGANLNAIFKTQYDNAELYLKLLCLEQTAHKSREFACNTGEEHDEGILSAVRRILGDSPAVFINGDPRGYSLKIGDNDTRELRQHGLNLYTDWGGCGIVAPDFTGE